MLPVQGQVPAKLSEEASVATEGIRDERVCEVLELCPRPKAICSESKTKTKNAASRQDRRGVNCRPPVASDEKLSPGGHTARAGRAQGKGKLSPERGTGQDEGLRTTSSGPHLPSFKFCPWPERKGGRMVEHDGWGSWLPLGK